MKVYTIDDNGNKKLDNVATFLENHPNTIIPIFFILFILGGLLESII